MILYLNHNQWHNQIGQSTKGLIKGKSDIMENNLQLLISSVSFKNFDSYIYFMFVIYIANLSCRFFQ